MADTARTRDYLLTQVFQDGQAEGSINEQDMRDFVVSVPRQGGFADYADTTTVGTPINLVADTWTTITNDGAGAFTNTAYLPTGVTQLMDTSTGQFDFSELTLGDAVIIRNDFVVTPAFNDAVLEMRYQLGTGGAAYDLETTMASLVKGASIPYRFSLFVTEIYMGDTNTKDNPATLQLLSTKTASVVNNGSVITVLRR